MVLKVAVLSMFISCVAFAIALRIVLVVNKAMSETRLIMNRIDKEADRMISETRMRSKQGKEGE
ncbi:unnamed protein product [marine sediment metagenome]|uniref:Uncharacterized protein n=1 Tax=marine sediment metagenome TaxID=412755 RepID=X1CF17_9ZZZZ